MKYLKSFLDKDFLYGFEKEYLQSMLSFDKTSLKLRESLIKLERILFFENITSNFHKDEIEEILMGTEHPILKSLLKISGHVEIKNDLFNGFELEANADRFITRVGGKPFQLYAFSDQFSLKKLNKYREYYGYQFFNLESIQSIEFNKIYQVGLEEGVSTEIIKHFKPYNSLIFIDPYILSNEKNTSKFLNLIQSIFPSRLRIPFYLDIITNIQSDQKFFDTQLSKLKDLLKELSEKYNTQYVLNVHIVSLTHDRCYIGNGFLVSMGHGLESLKSVKDSSIDYKNILDVNTISFIKDKLLFYKKLIKNKGDNPIWKVLN